MKVFKLIESLRSGQADIKEESLEYIVSRQFFFVLVLYMHTHGGTGGSQPMQARIHVRNCSHGFR